MENRNKKISDHEADESLKPLEALPIEVAPEFCDYFALRNTDIEPAGKRSHKSDNLTAGELKLLRAVVKYPMRASSEYPKLARISPNTFQKVRPGLMNKGLVREHKLDSNRRGRSTVLLEPLPEGIELISADKSKDVMGG